MPARPRGGHTPRQSAERDDDDARSTASGASPQERVLRALGFHAAYTVAVTSCFVASILTDAYVGTGAAREANPVVVAAIDAAGLPAAMVSRVLVVATLYWGYYVVAVATDRPWLGVAFAWLGALVHAADATTNAATAVALGPVAYPAGRGAVVVALVTVTALALWLRPPRLVAG